MRDILDEIINEHDLEQDKIINFKFTKAYQYLSERYKAEDRTMDEAMMYDLITAYELINRVLSVFTEQKELHPDYIIQKLNMAKYIINTQLKYQEEKKEKEREKNRKPIEYLDQLKVIFGVAAANSMDEVLVCDAIKILMRGTVDSSERYFLYDMCLYVRDIFSNNIDTATSNISLQNDIFICIQYLEKEVFNDGQIDLE